MLVLQKRSVRTIGWVGLPLLVLLAGRPAPVSTQGVATPPSFVEFESGQVRPVALSPNGSRLFVVNTPDDRLAIFDVTADGLSLEAEVPVGLEPVAVAARNDGEKGGGV